MAWAVRPCLPIILPTSSLATPSFDTLVWLPLTSRTETYSGRSTNASAMIEIKFFIDFTPAIMEIVRIKYDEKFEMEKDLYGFSDL